MPAGANPLAISEVDITLCQKVEVEKVLTESDPLLDQNDEVVEGDARDPMFHILDGKGDLPDGLLAGDQGDLGVTGVTGGKTIVTNSTETEHNETWNDWTTQAVNGPSAS